MRARFTPSAGTAGCALAARLTEDPNIRVLLLEAGGSGKAHFELRMPPAYPRLFHNTEVEYDLFTTEQAHAVGKKRFWPRGKVLGGSSSMNALMYIYSFYDYEYIAHTIRHFDRFHAGAPSDYDEWAQSGIEGSEGWAFAEFQNSKWIEACKFIGIPYVPDVNTIAGTMGVTKLMTYLNSMGMRVSSETAYLTPDVMKRPNLTIATYAKVTKVLFDTTGGKKRAVGVEFARGKGSKRYRVKARKEVILSGGAVHTPQILMLSGIGPAEHLREKSIPVIHDLPGVGQHLMDHGEVNLCFRVKYGESLTYLEPRRFRDIFRAIPKLLEWLLFGTGPITTNICEAAAFIRSADPALFPPSDYPEKLEDTTSSLDAPDIELLSSPLAWKSSTPHHSDVPIGELASFLVVLLRPTSTGAITLNSADPFEKPIIDPNYLATQHDIDVFVRGVQLALRIARTEPLFSLLDKTETDPFLDQALHERSPLDIEAVIRDRVDTLYHPTSTARMAPLEAGGVVDAYLRVHGVEGLRVVDASIFPTINSGHTTAPVYAVAEKAADIIKGQFYTI
ncbi:hypothetical protein EW145_g5999 [Phellinidium pouzarii]|uniref:Glucose-methanol-choline oxidoreductase N-terminal domain-containing protein n=1 Tax=Phellinidium pouzarii TaxID=167371 RepID=A0A4S4KY36_9AGAM|nr:hypothetical protein EW145_g5999 [Phellinidium pouzarii]